jgi:hypothetical protein
MATSSFTLLSANTKDHLALVKSTDGSTIEISWKELALYVPFLKVDADGQPPLCSHMAQSIVDDRLVICATAENGVEGIIAIRDLDQGAWVYIARADYAWAALPLFDHGLVIIMFYLNLPMLPPEATPHLIRVAQLDGVLDASQDRAIPRGVIHPGGTPSFPSLEIEQRPAIEGEPPLDWTPAFSTQYENGQFMGLYLDPSALVVHAIDRKDFHGQYSLSELQEALSKTHP